MRIGIAQCLMHWWRRCLVVLAAVCYVALAFIWSCGGGSSSSSTPTPIPQSLVSVAICAGTPFSPTPTPSPNPSSTPTPICSPVGATAIATPTTLFFNAQGSFAKSKNSGRRRFRDLTNDQSTVWFISGDLTPTGANGIYSVPSADGCGSISARDGGLFSKTVEVTIGSPATPCPTP
jgi:hypothetical protein